MGQDFVLIWSYLSKFVIPLTDFPEREVFHDALSGYGKKFQVMKAVTYICMGKGGQHTIDLT